MSRKRKLKLCFTGDASSVHVQKAINFFVDSGHEVHVVDDHSYNYKNLKMHYLKKFTGIKLIDYFYRLIKAVQIIRKLKPDLVYSQQVTYHGFLGALSGVHPFVITPWGADILYDPERSAINRRIMKLVFDKADAIHYIDQSLMDRVSEVYGDTTKKAFLLNEGVNTKIFKKTNRGKKRNKENNKVSILCLRAPTKYYDSVLLIEALNIIINKYGYVNVQGIMCNRSDSRYIELAYEHKLEKLVDKYNLRKYMKFFKYTRDVNFAPKIMKDADIYVDTMCRFIKGQGTGKTALEAMSSELAMVMPDNPSIELYIKHMKSGIIYKKNDAESLAKALMSLIKNNGLRLKLGKNARKFILNKLDWNRNMLKMEKKFYELAEVQR